MLKESAQKILPFLGRDVAKIVAEYHVDELSQFIYNLKLYGESDMELELTNGSPPQWFIDAVEESNTDDDLWYSYTNDTGQGGPYSYTHENISLRGTKIHMNTEYTEEHQYFTVRDRSLWNRHRRKERLWQNLSYLTIWPGNVVLRRKAQMPEKEATLPQPRLKPFDIIVIVFIFLYSLLVVITINSMHFLS